MVLSLAAFANAAGYILYAGNPLLSSDAWYFVDAFLRKAMEDGASIQDYYVKRSADDHAQPLLKLLLLANAEWFGLDFVLEALAGLLFALLTYVVLARAALANGPDGRIGWRQGFGLGVVAACLVTLNAGMVFNWSLVTLGYLSYLLAALAGFAAWRVLAKNGGARQLVASAVAVAFLLDGTGVLVSIAILLATGGYALRHPGSRRNAAIVVLAFVLAQACYQFLGRLVLFPGVDVSSAGMEAGGRLQVLWGMRAQLGEAMVTVFGSTMAHLFTLKHYAGEQARAWQTGLALVAMALHAWFWLSAWRKPWNAAGFLAVVLMLLMYGAVAGIVLARVPVNGVDYLHEPRYVVFYLLSNVALAMMYLARLGTGHAPAFRLQSPIVLMVLLALLQLPLSAFTWRDGRHLHAYYHAMARQTYALGNGVVPTHCIALVSACHLPEQERAQTMDFLREHRLNVYSPAFVQRYRLDALAAE
ncbi:hypothetical protein MASR1M8_09290 [Thermomonas brevis]